MAVPTSFTGLSTTPGSNSPVAGDNVFPDLDDFLRIMQAMLASIYANTATNGWVAPYLPLAGGTMAGAVTGITNLTTLGNTILGNAQGDTLNVAGGAIAVGAGGNVTVASPASGAALSVTGDATVTGTANIGDISTNSVAMTGYLLLPAVAVASLTAPTTAYLRAFVTDATATTFASIVVGGGSNRVPVFSDGTNWRIG